MLEKTFKHGGTYADELDAAKRVNQMCDESQIERKNPNVDASPKLKTRNPTSEYKGVSWRTRDRKWTVNICIHKIKYYAGDFDEEIEAARKVNQICDGVGIKRKNPQVNATPNVKARKTSEYKGVCWSKRERKWAVHVSSHNHKYFGGYFDEEMEAATKVNQLCDEIGIKRKNHDFHSMSKQKRQQKNNMGFLKPDKSKQADTKKLKRKRTVPPNYDATKREFIALIKILDENNDPAACTMKENLIKAIGDREQIIITEINLRTKNGNSLLSIAAKHGFANVVKFLISKGAEKEHFTNDFHTPLSLAVSQNHLRVVQVLFEEWISPNSHEKPYLHLLPIFNVKSREIAQLLVDNDAVTGGLYNNKNQSPLTAACQNGYLDVVEFFLDDGLDINHLDNDNKTPLFYALQNKHHDVVNLLIFKGAKDGFLPN